jgi:diaminohydroxyphosphoribosylaminopyrimidine deaminase/5-amino-6-(5-phosphoribosylamino)uracil reductase
VVTKAAAGAEPARARALEAAGATILALDDRDLGRALGELVGLGLQSLLIEGGGRLHRAAWQAGVVDRVEAWVTPRAIGPEGVPWVPAADLSLAALHELRVERCGPDVRIEGYVHRVD